MPVIQLPRDTRWGDLGLGLGQVLGAAVEGAQKQAVMQKVAEVWDDPKVPQDQKLSESMKRYGQQGYDAASQLYKAKLLQAEMAKTQEQAKEAHATGLLRQAQVDKALLEMPGITEAQRALIQQRQAQAAAEQAKADEAKARIPEIGEQVKATRALTEERTESAGEKRAQADKANVETQLKQIELDQQKAAGDPGAFDVETAFKQLVPDATPEQVSAAKLEFAGGKTQPERVSKLAAYATKLQTAKAAAAKPVSLSESEEKRAIEHGAALSNMQTAFKAFQAKPSGVGLTAGAPVTQWLEGHGIATGNPQQVEIWTSAARTVLDAAKAGSLFISGTTIKAAKDITPGLTETPLHFTQVVNAAARENLARLNSERNLLSVQRQTPAVMAEYDRLIKGWQDIEEGSRIDYWATYMHDGKTLTGRSAVIYGGNAVDPKSFNVLVRGDKQYPLKNGGTMGGATIIARAKELQEDVVTVAREMGATIK